MQAQRALDYLETDIIPRSVQKPLMPSILQVNPTYRDEIDGQYHIGGMGRRSSSRLCRQRD